MDARNRRTANAPAVFNICERLGDIILSVNIMQIPLEKKSAFKKADRLIKDVHRMRKARVLPRLTFALLFWQKFYYSIFLNQ